MITRYFVKSLRWIRSQIIGILIAIIALLAAAVYAAPYTPSTFGFAKYDVSCFSDSAGHAICVRIDTTTGDSNCRYDDGITNIYGGWVDCHSASFTPSSRNPWYVP